MMESKIDNTVLHSGGVMPNVLLNLFNDRDEFAGRFAAVRYAVDGIGQTAASGKSQPKESIVPRISCVNPYHVVTPLLVRL